MFFARFNNAKKGYLFIYTEANTKLCILICICMQNTHIKIDSMKFLCFDFATLGLPQYAVWIMCIIVENIILKSSPQK